MRGNAARVARACARRARRSSAWSRSRPTGSTPVAATDEGARRATRSSTRSLPRDRAADPGRGAARVRPHAAQGRRRAGGAMPPPLRTGARLVVCLGALRRRSPYFRLAATGSGPRSRGARRPRMRSRRAKRHQTPAGGAGRRPPSDPSSPGFRCSSSSRSSRSRSARTGSSRRPEPRRATRRRSSPRSSRTRWTRASTTSAQSATRAGR